MDLELCLTQSVWRECIVKGSNNIVWYCYSSHGADYIQHLQSELYDIMQHLTPHYLHTPTSPLSLSDAFIIKLHAHLIHPKKNMQIASMINMCLLLLINLKQCISAFLWGFGLVTSWGIQSVPEARGARSTRAEMVVMARGDVVKRLIKASPGEFINQDNSWWFK